MRRRNLESTNQKLVLVFILGQIDKIYNSVEDRRFRR